MALKYKKFMYDRYQRVCVFAVITVDTLQSNGSDRRTGVGCAICRYAGESIVVQDHHGVSVVNESFD